MGAREGEEVRSGNPGPGDRQAGDRQAGDQRAGDRRAGALPSGPGPATRAVSQADAAAAAPARLLVWGAGAIGGTVAACLLARQPGGPLAGAGTEAVGEPLDLTLVDANEAHVDAMRERGLEIRGPIHTFRVPVRALRPAEVEGRWPAALLCVKAQHTAAALSALHPHLDDGPGEERGWVASLQNGLNELHIARELGAARTVGAFVNFGADLLEPGVIHFGGRGAVVVGELDGRDSARLRRLHGWLRRFDPAARTSDDIWGFLWGKMAYGGMLFASALTDASIAEVLDAREVRPALDALAREVLAVAAAEGVTPKGFNGFDPAAFAAGGAGARAASYDAMVAHNRRSAKTHSGVWRDLAVHRRETEFQAQFGPIFERADAHGVAVPCLRRLARTVREVESGARGRGWHHLTELAATAAGAPGVRDERAEPNGERG